MNGHLNQVIMATTLIASLVGTAHFISEFFMWVSTPLNSEPLRLASSIDGEAFPFNHQTQAPVPISLVVPCQAEDFPVLPLFFESLANQTVAPVSTHLVLNLPTTGADGAKLSLLGLADSDDSWLKAAAHDPSVGSNGLPVSDKKLTLTEAIDRLLKERAPVQLSMLRIPHITLHLRAGQHYAGDNRMYGANASSTDGTQIVSFFDCDDYLHPQRTEFLWKTFQEHPELDALVHLFQSINITSWDKMMPKFLETQDYMPDNQTFPWSYEEIYSKVPFHEFASEPNGEPRQIGKSLFWFPHDMELSAHPPYTNYGHNGWLTIRREVLNSVPYPTKLARGQDSLYNYRLIKAHKKFNVLPIRLAAYMRPH
eukprot:Protomagalhaensia_sp_Gyna_25__1050@NODE_1506_length_1775_cov_47_139401_g1221_i0_p1_GENE_NODE_1506_length_1775_cov_47_139401_g1221_i0NODE_1506_length_1775_cov_47_139401_g1221_i0_p1_ORF_typecomplete_len368_score47_49Glycos_transf_2/PF00535_26/2_2e03Glycos_transf_2/PF00535_26/4_6e03Glycos_transf_2/PF00535_26/9e05Glyco_tranf_2_3/PF13641_6/0_0011Erg28/PF03694_13/0_17_NODE_1506_length_1775_cov_47_139401_g1221_i02581361